MSIAATIGSVVSTIIKPLADAYIKNQDRKQAKESASSKIKMARDQQSNQVTLTDAEGEAVLASGLDKSWKDEYVTVSIVSIFNLLIFGGIYGAFSTDYRLLQGTVEGITALQALNVDIGFLLSATVLAAIGLKIWRS